MTARVRYLLLGAAVVGPLALFPLLKTRPELGIAAFVAVVIAYLAGKSVAIPVAMSGIPDVIIAFKGSDPFPPKASIYFEVGWLFVAMFLTLLREKDVLPLRLLTTGPVLLTLVLVGLLLARLGASTDPTYGSYKVQLFLATGVVSLFAGIVIGGAQKRFDLWLVLALAMAGLSGLALARSIVQGQASTIYQGRFALFAQASPISLGRASAFGLLLGVFVLISKTSHRRRVLALVSVPLLLVAVLSAGSRGPTLGLAVGLLVLFSLTVTDRQVRRRLLLVAVGGVIAGVVAMQLVPGQNLTRSLSFILDTGAQGHGGTDSNGRTSLFSAGWDAFASHPLFGIGTGSFPTISPTGDLYPHNIVLEGLTEEGILGGLVVLGFLFFAVRGPWRLWRASLGEQRGKAALVLSLLGMEIVNASVSGTFENSGNIWLAAGIGLGLGGPAAGSLRLPRRRGEPGQEPDAGQGKASVPLRAGSAPGSGGITSPPSGAALTGEVQVTAVPAETGWSVSKLTVECSPDGREWTELGAAEVEEAFDVYLAGRGAGARRRHVAVVQSRERAEALRVVLEGDQAAGGERVEIVPSRRKPWTTGESRGTQWDTVSVPDGDYRLRAVTTDVAGHVVWSPEIAVSVDNVAPLVALESPHPGPVLHGPVELFASATDEASGVAGIRFQVEHGRDWIDVATADQAPFRARWDAGRLVAGEYRLRAVAVDRAGNEAQSAPVAVQVGAVPEPVTLELPVQPLHGQVLLRADAGSQPVEWVAFQAAVADRFDWHTVAQVSEAPFEAVLDVSAWREGLYDLRAVVSRAGNVDCSRPVRKQRVVGSPAPVAPPAPALAPAAPVQDASSEPVAAPLLVEARPLDAGAHLDLQGLVQYVDPAPVAAAPVAAGAEAPAGEPAPSEPTTALQVEPAAPPVPAGHVAYGPVPPAARLEPLPHELAPAAAPVEPVAHDAVPAAPVAYEPPPAYPSAPFEPAAYPVPAAYEPPPVPPVPVEPVAYEPAPVPPVPAPPVAYEPPPVPPVPVEPVAYEPALVPPVPAPPVAYVPPVPVEPLAYVPAPAPAVEPLAHVPAPVEPVAYEPGVSAPALAGGPADPVVFAPIEIEPPRVEHVQFGAVEVAPVERPPVEFGAPDVAAGPPPAPPAVFQPAAAQPEPVPAAPDDAWLVPERAEEPDPSLPPTEVWLLEPAPGAFAAGAIRLSAGVDSPLPVLGVRFECSADGHSWWDLGTLREPPFTFGWDTRLVRDGLYWLRAVAEDADWRSTLGEPVFVQVANGGDPLDGSFLAPVPEPDPAEGTFAHLPPFPDLSPPAPTPEPGAGGPTLVALEEALRVTDPADPQREQRAALLQMLRTVTGPDGLVPAHFRALVEQTFGVGRPL